MKKLSRILTAVMVPVLVITALVQVPPAVSATPTDAPLDIVPLNILWRVKAARNDGGVDYKTITSYSELQPYIASGKSEGMIFYVPNKRPDGSLVSGTAEFNRLRSSAGPDHGDSQYHDEGTYLYDTTLGYPWTSSTATPGLSQLMTIYNLTNFDRATIRPGEFRSGYSSPGTFARYGYNRYNTLSSSMLSLTAGGVTIESDGLGGGMLSRWWWNGYQFLNNPGYGRAAQASLFLDNTEPQQNPTEAGDLWSEDVANDSNPVGLPPEVWHGSPLLSLYNDTSNPTSPVQISRAVPLDWLNSREYGGDGPPTPTNPGTPNHPIIYKDVQMGKNIQLNYKNMGPVAKYTTYLKLPTALTDSHIYIPSIYLRGNFNTYYWYDAATQIETSVPLTGCNTSAISESLPGGTPTFGGAIISEGANGRAMGLFGVKTTGPNGSVTLYKMNRLLGCPNQTGTNGEKDSNTSALSALYRTTFPQGEKLFNTWIISGNTKDDVKAKMRALYMDCTVNPLNRC